MALQRPTYTVKGISHHDVDEHLGYIDDNQKQELLTVLHSGHRHTLRSHKSNKQLLRELIMGMYKPMIDLKEVTKANLEKIVPSVFVNTKREPILLAKEKKVPSRESCKIEEFLATLHK